MNGTFQGCILLEIRIVSGYKVIDDAIMASFSLPGPTSAGIGHYKKWVILLEEFVEASGKEYFKPCELMRSGKFIEMKK